MLKFRRNQGLAWSRLVFEIPQKSAYKSSVGSFSWKQELLEIIGNNTFLFLKWQREMHLDCSIYNWLLRFHLDFVSISYIAQIRLRFCLDFLDFDLMFKMKNN